MKRRIAPLFLAVLIALPVVAPVSATEPAAPTPSQVGPAETVAPTSGELAESGVPTQADSERSAAAEPADAADLASDQGDDTVEADDVTRAAGADSDARAGQTLDGRPDTTGRFIVMLRNGADTTAVVEKAAKRNGLKTDSKFAKTFRGFAARLDKNQKRDLLADPDVVAVVPDGVVQLTAQTIPNGVTRIGGPLSPTADIDGRDGRVNADVAIVDTGIALHPDLNVAGGYNCSSSDRSAWRDKNHHGTHVAGTVGALDNGIGVVGVAPGARVWGVKILNDDGYGLISWYICGLDWILAQRDPSDSTRPLFEAVNMSVTKYGSDDKNCGRTTIDLLHQAICRVVAGGITVVAAAANDHHNAAANIPASYNEVITVSALADTDGKTGGLGGNLCYSWGSYDKDETFADFSNYGGDVDIMAPGKCIWSTIPGPSYSYMSGTSMAAPTVAGAVALYKSTRPKATPAEVREALRYLGNLSWATSTDPDSTHEPLLNVARIDALGTFTLSAAATPSVEGGATVTIPITVKRSASFFERVVLSIASVPAGWTKGAVSASLMGWTANAGTISVVVPKATPSGTYDVVVKGTNQGRTITTTASVVVQEIPPVATAPRISLISGVKMGLASQAVRATWDAATDPSSPIAGYEVEASANGGPFGSTIARTVSQPRAADFTIAFGTNYAFRVRALDTAGNWSDWATTAGFSRINAIDDRSSTLIGNGPWVRLSSTSAWRNTLTGSSTAGAYLRTNVTGQAFTITGPRSPSRGKVRVYVDNVLVATIDMRANASYSRQVVFAHAFAISGSHAVRLEVVGGGADSLFQLDALVVQR